MPNKGRRIGRSCNAGHCDRLGRHNRDQDRQFRAPVRAAWRARHSEAQRGRSGHGGVSQGHVLDCFEFFEVLVVF